ncbi:MAG: TonB-dependent receptor plug domain-containing protein [Rubrivivax sp.]
MKPRHFGWLVVAQAPWGLAWAQQAAEPEPQRIEIRATEVSDTEQRRRQPVAKDIVGREELDRYGDPSVSEVLKRVPGVQIQGGSPRMRGLGAGYTQILVNGEKAPPGFSLDNLPPSQVERIEITKGPTAEYSAQAVAGTINIILRQPSRNRQRELRLGLGYQVERPVASFSANWADQWGALSAALPVSGWQWRGGSESFTQRTSRDVLLNPLRLESEGASRWWGHGWNFGPRVNWKLDERHTLESTTFAQRHDFRSTGRSAITVLEGLPPPSVQDNSSNRGWWQMLRSGVQLVRRDADGSRLELKVGGQVTASEFRTDASGRNAAGELSVLRLTTGRSEEDSSQVGVKFSRPLGDAHALAMGWEVETRRREESRTVIENGVPQLSDYEGDAFRARILRQALWAQDEWEVAPRWATSIGLRAERIALVSVGASEEVRNRSQVVTPLWHLTHRLDEKGRDLVRASLTRSYRAPDLSRLLARPSINSAYPVSGPNPEISPDRVGNPALRPELATGVDLAFEKYLQGNGVVSIGAFARTVDGLMRNVTSLQSVSWAAVPRWVSRPVNLGRARSVGVELEAKGKATDLLGAGTFPAGLSLRASLSVYRSTVEGIPGPDNRLEGQQPWSANLGFDHTFAGTPLSVGGNASRTPPYAVQQTVSQRLEQGPARSIDAYAMWTFSREAVLRVSVNNAWPLKGVSQTRFVESGGFVQSSLTRSQPHASFNAGLTLRF